MVMHNPDVAPVQWRRHCPGRRSDYWAAKCAAPVRATDASVAFTLIEVLIVLSLLLVLAGIALPTTKEILSDQKVSRAARSISAYFNEARSEAIAKSRYVGVRIERLIVPGTTGSDEINFGTATSIRLRRITGQPSYSGEAADARVAIVSTANGIANLEFARADNLLLTLANEPNPPIGNGSLIEFPGGKLYPLGSIVVGATVTAQIDLNAPANPLDPNSSETFPLGHRLPAIGQFKYRIHRRPTVSAAKSLPFTRGIALDLNHSGIGVTGNQFIPTSAGVNQPIDILFGPDGQIASVSLDSLGNSGPPIGMIYLCLGTTDGVIEPPDPAVAATLAELYQSDDTIVSNITNPDSIWVVINPGTGRVATAPFVAIDGVPASIGEGLVNARSLAILSDTIDGEP